MSDNDSKRYYWLKLTNDFFDSHEMKSLKAQPNGRIYALIYLELLAESTTHDGALRFSKMIPYDIPTLAAVINEDQDSLKGAIDILVKMELIEILDDQTIYMEQLKEMVGSETKSAKRKREYRNQIEWDNVPQVSQECHLEYRDKSIEIRDKKNNNKPSKYKYGDYSNVALSDDERTKLNEKFGDKDTEAIIQWFSAYIEEKGYKCKSHYLAILRWVGDAYYESLKRKPKPKEAIPSYKQENNQSYDEELFKQIMEKRDGSQI